MKGCVSFWKSVIACGFRCRERWRLPVEIRDEPALRVGDGSQYRHDARAGLESGLLSEECSGGKYQRG
jgi:hypothetical protein